MNRFGTSPTATVGPRRPMPFRHKLMLLLALELVAIGVHQSERNPHHPGVTVEAPARSGHIIT